MSLLSESDYRVAIVALGFAMDNKYLGGNFRAEARDLRQWLQLQMAKKYPGAPASQSIDAVEMTEEEYELNPVTKIDIAYSEIEEHYKAMAEAAALADELDAEMACGWDPNSGPTC